jgi:hypothetical protein
MEFVYKSLQKMVPAILASTGSRTIFKARCFKELVSVARDLAGGTLVTP